MHDDHVTQAFCEDRARELRTRLASLSDSSDTRRAATETVELDQQRNGRLTRMDALQGQAMARATHARAELERRRIEAALERLSQGRYGICARCEENIAPGRLRADPATPLCIDCAEASGR